MSLPTVTDAAYPTQDELRGAILTAIIFAFQKRGLVANVGVGSDHYIRADKYAQRVAIAIANNKLAAAAMNPLTATGSDLVTLASVFGVSPRPAGPSAGAVTIVCTGTITIPAGFLATCPNGTKIQTVSIALNITTGTAVDVIATTGGASTDQAAGTQVTWDSAAIGALNPRATVTSAGLTGGADADGDEQLRDRLLQKLAFPPGGGNWAQVVEWAEEATASVELAFAYPAVRGPASYDVAVTKAGGNRTLSAAIVNTVKGFVIGKMPGQQDGNFTSVTAQGVDVVLSAILPLPQVAGGAGGGWRDAIPWPAEIAKITAYAAPLATVNSTAAPATGNSIGVWDATVDPPVMREYVITGLVGGIAGAWTFRVQGGFISSPLGAYVSAGALSLVQYADAFAAQTSALGPGEKTTLPELLPRARREPATDFQSPSDLTTRLTGAVQNQFSELAVDYAARYATGTTTPLSSPSVPAATADPPNILVLKQFAIIKQ